jgi:hypothetical protein
MTRIATFTLALVTTAPPMVGVATFSVSCGEGEPLQRGFGHGGG